MNHGLHPTALRRKKRSRTRNAVHDERQQFADPLGEALQNAFGFHEPRGSADHNSTSQEVNVAASADPTPPPAQCNIAPTDDHGYDGANLASDSVHQETCDDSDEEVSPPSSQPIESNLSLLPFKWDWQTLWSLLLLNGTQKVTVNQFQSIRSLVDSVINQTLSLACPGSTEKFRESIRRQVSKFPHPRSIRRSSRVFVLNLLAVRRQSAELPVCHRNGLLAHASASSLSPMIDFRIVPVSEFARADLACPSIFQVMHTASLSGFRSEVQDESALPPATRFCVDTIPVVQSRLWFYGPQASASMDRDPLSSNTCQAGVGDTITISLVRSGTIRRAVNRTFALKASENFRGASLAGTIICIWTVQHSSKSSYPPDAVPATESLPSRDQNLVSILAFADGPRRMTRRQSTAPRPALKPADLVVMLRPVRDLDIANIPCGEHCLNCADDPDSDSRLLLVYRFWRDEGERKRHALFLDSTSTASFTPIFQQPDLGPTLDKLSDVACLRLVRYHRRRRGPESHPPVSSFGRLDSGEHYFVYRFILYWDGFTIHSGRQASAIGFYIVPLNIPPHNRNSQHAVRVASFAPPGVSASSVLDFLMKDIEQGASDGFLDFDAKGTRRRIFLDLVGITGDTPALNACLDSLGHTATAPCHLCSIRKGSPSSVGSVLTSLDATGFNSITRRTASRHQCLRDNGLPNSEYNFLGMQHSPTSCNLALLRVKSALDRARCTPYNTQAGSVLLPNVFDPFRGCWIAPDHCLTGLIKNTLELCFVLITSTGHRRLVEAFMLHYLRCADLAPQAKILSEKETTLFTMTMTQLYSVSLIAPYAFNAAFPLAETSSSSVGCFRPSYPQALLILQSINSITTRLFLFPSKRKDETHTINSFNAVSTREFAAETHTMVERHVRLVEEICTMPENDVRELEGYIRDPARRKELDQKLEDCTTAIRHLDKPNLHRLLEMTGVTVPMTRHIGLASELVLEKRHQILKRAVRTSNQKAVHDHAINCACFNDWQSRLTMCLLAEDISSTENLLSCYRLLYGRERVASCAAELSIETKEELVQFINEASCLTAELRDQNVSLLSNLGHRRAFHLAVATVGDPLPLMDSHKIFSDVVLPIALDCAISKTSLWSGISVKSSSFSRRCCIARNSILRHLSLCAPAGPSLPVLHAPPTNTEQVHGNQTLPSTASLWCVLDVLSVTLDTSRTLYFARCLPVSPAEYFGELGSYRVDLQSHPSLVPLTNHLQTAAYIHDCAKHRCICDPNSGTIEHHPSSTPLDGGSFFILSRENGYPPRSG